MNTADAREAWNARYAASEFVWTDRPNQFVEAGLTELEPGTAIDLGSGEGRNAVWLARRGWQVTAVDFSAAGLAKAGRLATEHGVNVVLVEHDVLTFDPATPVDLVLVSYLQIERADQARMLRRASGWLAPGGTLFVIAHDRSNIDNGYGGPPSPEVCYTPEETVAALRDLHVDRAEVVERVVDTDTGPQTALDTLLIAHRPGSR